MKKLLLSIALVLFAGATMAQNAVEFTFTRNGNGATVAVNGAEGVTATIAATSASNAWNTGGDMASSTDVLCPNTNTSATSEGSPMRNYPHVQLQMLYPLHKPFRSLHDPCFCMRND